MTQVSRFDIRRGETIICEIVPTLKKGKKNYRALFKCSKLVDNKSIPLPVFEEIFGLEASDLSLANIMYDGNPRVMFTANTDRECLLLKSDRFGKIGASVKCRR